MSQFSTAERDVFVRRMCRRGASWSHCNMEMQAIGMMVGERWVHLTFSDRPEDYGRVWVTTMRGDGTDKMVRWVDGDIEDWLYEFRADATRPTPTEGGPR